MLKEQRSYSRFSVEGSVVLKPEDATLRTIRADLYDICYIGIGVGSAEKIDAGIHVKFELTINSIKETIAGEGKIVYVYETKRDNTLVFRMGIEFINIDKKKMIRILSLIQQDMMKPKSRR
jgi:c-di-GMP-binding flagellar brake protein YcgR